MEHPAEIFNKIKNMAFAIYHKSGYAAACSFVDANYEKLGHNGYIGLKAEIGFYERYKDSMFLTPSLDYGIKCDFSGMFDKSICRFDVTTNINFKHLKDFEPIQSKTTIPYKIAVVDHETGAIEDIFDINFPVDQSGEGRLFEILIFHHGDVNEHSEFRNNPYQEVYQISNVNPLYENKLIDTLTDWYIPDIKSYEAELWENIYDDDSSTVNQIKKEVTSYIVENAKFLSKEYVHNIVACGQRSYQYIGKDGDGEYTTKIYWQHPVIEGYLPDDLGFEI